jgi:hypothetical protein
VNVIAFIEKACFRPVVGPQLIYRCADVIDRVAAQVVAVRLAAYEPVALWRPAS